ncbi:MAG: glycosyltransferase [Eubacteriales bacterium]|nr:glycosyltransferase [Eubacteriales bacterium]
MEFKEICLLNDSFPPIIDGVANVVVNYAREIEASGHSVSVVTPQHPEADDSQWSFPVVRYPSLDLRENIGYMAGNPFSLNAQLQLSQRPISLLHSHCPVMSNIFARTLRNAMDVPLIMTYHTKFDIDINNAIRSKLLQTGAIKALVNSVSACDELWVVSRGAGENIRSLGYEGDYIVMENGVDMPKGRVPEAEVQEVVKDYDLPKKVPVFLFVGRLMWYKGLRIILDALAALKSQNLDFRMIFIGGGGDEQEVKAYTEQLKLGDKVFFIGPVRDRQKLAAWYCRADLFLFPSTFDTNGLVVREAAAFSLGSVLVGGSCAAENVTNGVDGLLIEENAASLAVCLARIMENADAMHNIGMHASDNLYISWHEAVQKAMERYEIVLDNYHSQKTHHRHAGFSEEFFTFSGDLLNTLAGAEEYRKELEDKLERYW